MWPELRCTVLYPPPPPRPYRCDDYGDYVFMVSRLTPLKRADLLIRALATPAGQGIRAVIAGEGEERGRLHGAGRASSDWRTASRLTGARDRAAAARPPGAAAARCASRRSQEDYGFVTVEAFASRKAGGHLRRQRRPGGARRRRRARLRVQPDPGGHRPRAAPQHGRPGCRRAHGRAGARVRRAR